MFKTFKARLYPIRKLVFRLLTMKLKFKKSNINRYINYYYGWYKTFDKDLYKYATEQLIEDLDLKTYNKLTDKQKENLYSQLISLTHNIAGGGSNYEIHI